MSDNSIASYFDANADFEATIDALYQRASRLEKEELEDFAAAEQYIQQSYEGRSLFKLIQSGRDAAQLAQQPSLIELELTEQADGHWLLVRNSGLPFTPAGVAGITRIGQSTKADAKTIGFKGIGFKAVRQLTDHPRVVTSWGTLLFDTASDDAHCRLYALENPFLYAGQESRWHNARFRAEADTVRISLQIGS